jgi:hypothetical protein
MPYKYGEPIVLSGTTQRERQETVFITDEDFGGGSQVNWSIHKFTLHGGKQEGVELVKIFNGKLKILVAPTRGMGILSVDASDCGLGWRSPITEVVHPHFIDRHDRGGLGWLEGFNEWLVRCGLEFAGGPGNDEVTNNAGEKVQMDLTLHGKVAHIPASHVEVIVYKDGRICLKGVVHERTFLGPKLSLTSCISTVINSERFQIEDVVENCSATAQEFQLIYHTNFGFPLLEAGAEAVLPVKRITPMNSHAAAGADAAVRFDGPQAGFIEQVFLMELFADSTNQTGAMLKNRDSDLAVTLEWNALELPYFTLWKNLAAECDGYVIGFEPGTSFPFNRRQERDCGRVPVLEPMGRRHFFLACEIHRGLDEVARKGAAIQRSYNS